MISFEDQVRERLGLSQDDDCFVWFVDEYGTPIKEDNGLRLVFCQGLIRYWNEIFD